MVELNFDIPLHDNSPTKAYSQHVNYYSYQTFSFLLIQLPTLLFLKLLLNAIDLTSFIISSLRLRAILQQDNK